MKGKWTSKWRKALSQRSTKGYPNCGLEVPTAFNFCPRCGKVQR